MLKKNKILFLGDSLTAGVDCNDIMDYNSKTGYSHLICEYFKNRRAFGSSLNFAVSGLTSHGLLHMLDQEISYNENIAYNITPEYTYRSGIREGRSNSALLLKRDISIYKAIKQADYIYISIGSNDFVRYYENGGVKKLNVNIISQIKRGLYLNLQEILDIIKNINGNCKVFIVGSYVPTKLNVVNTILEPILNATEIEIYEELVGKYDDVYYVSISNMVDRHRGEFLSRSTNIHPSNRGYMLMYTEIIKTMDENS